MQLYKRFNFDFMLPVSPDIGKLDIWLNEVFAIPHQQLTAMDVSTVRTDAQLWLYRVLLLCRELLLAGQMPFFDSPGIITCRRNKSADFAGRWNAVIALPFIDNIPLSAYRIALSMSSTLSVWAAEHQIDDENCEHFFSLIKKEVLDPLSTLVPAGKSTIPILRVAHAKKIPIIHLGRGVYQLGWGSKARRVDRSITEVDSAIGAVLAQNKVVTARLLRQAGLPAADHDVVTTLQKAHESAARRGWPVVVKPVDLDRGEGVSVDIADEKSLETAFHSAVKLSRSKDAIIERQVPGLCHRLFIVNGKLLYAVRRLPLSVRGDGKHTVSERVAHIIRQQRRIPPWRRSEMLPLDDLARTALVRAGFSESTVLEAGALAPLRRIESTQWGGTDDDVSHAVHPENLRIALDAAQLFGLQVAGIDIISADISQPWFDNGAIINEVNFAPQLGAREVSRRQIPAYLDSLVDGDGRIPVEVYVGGAAALEKALKRRKTLQKRGLATCLMGGDETFSTTGDTWHLSLCGSYLRVRAVVLSSRVDALILVVQTDEFLATGLPLEMVDRVTIIDDQLRAYRHGKTIEDRNLLISSQRFSAVKRQLQQWSHDYREIN